jgi:3-methylcrotonyl-CoA carboxylase alpha subunit
MMFKKLLIANRGEIACRIIKTAKKMGIRTVAVYSEIDADALHVHMADESVCIGPAPSIASYLVSEKIIQAAKATQAEAVHPGYGFLSEDDEFALLLQQAGIIFVGPTPEAIRIMGDKNLAKETVVAAGVPVVPGYSGDPTDFNALKTAAKKIGYPVLIKAAAGGGGKGMRLVEKPEQLAAAIESAMREAQASFGDARVFLEKYLEDARHIEVQILFDHYGKGIYLFDRDCSIQRRHQKVIEEAPAPGLSESTRRQMAKTALQAGEAIQYRSTGTIEFLVDKNQNFYFMEMNTRLQVEHPVTEMITGLDLVEWQLRIAAGEKLTLTEKNIESRGHAIEARLYAENPQNNFMPSAGELLYFQLPIETPHTVRVDSGFQAGDIVSVYYDPLLAKLIAWGENRLTAIQTLQHMLGETAVMGIHTNLTLLNRIIRHPQFIDAKITTQFIPEHQSQLLKHDETVPDYLIALACLVLLKLQHEQAEQYQSQSCDALSPWFLRDHWRLCHPAPSLLTLWHGEHTWPVQVLSLDAKIKLAWNKQLFLLSTAKIASWFLSCAALPIARNEGENSAAPLPRGIFLDKSVIASLFQKEGVASSVTVVINENLLTIFSEGEQWQLATLNPATQVSGSQTRNGLQAPMPGTIVSVDVQPGQTVTAGDRLLVMEAMKMEHSLLAPRDGKIQTIFYKPGDRVNEGVELIAFF